MRLLYGEDRTVASFVAAIIPGCERGFENYKAVGVVKEGSLVGGFVYHNWNPDAGVIEISGASTDRRWLDRTSLEGLFGYPFDQLCCQMVVMRVSAGDHQKHLHRILHAYGFRSILIPRLRGRDEDEMIFTLTDDDWRANRFNRDRPKFSEA